MNPSSMSKPSESVEPWPQDGVPEHWVNELFKRMSRMWGNAFLDKWPADDLRGVKIEWAKGLRKLSNAELKAGVDALLSLKFPPSLPEFHALCKQMRLAEQPQHDLLTDQTRAAPEVAHANTELMRAAVARLLNRSEPTAEWAFQVLMRGKSKFLGKPLTAEVIRCCADAISSIAGRMVVENCTDPELKREYAEIRQATVEGYRAKGMPLWEVR
jgi:hypothetical protein